MLGLGKRIAALHGTSEENGETGQTAQEKKDENSCELGKIGLVVGILAIALVIVLYVSHDLRIAKIQADVSDKLAAVSAVNDRVGSLEKRMGAIEALPELAKKMYLDNAIDDMKQRAATLAGMAGEEQKAALAKVEEILGGLQHDPAK